MMENLIGDSINLSELPGQIENYESPTYHTLLTPSESSVLRHDQQTSASQKSLLRTWTAEQQAIISAMSQPPDAPSAMSPSQLFASASTSTEALSGPPVNVNSQAETISPSQGINTNTRLYRLLNAGDSSGKIVLSKAKKGRSLNPSARNSLTKFVIKHLLDNLTKHLPGVDVLEQFEITTEQFIYWSKEVESTFPGESRYTYYTPFKKNDLGEQINASGKFWHHYNYKKDCLCNSGLLKSKKNQNDANYLPIPESKLEKI